MALDITIPSPGESVSEVVLGSWHRKSGEWVEKDDVLVEIESDKVTLEVPAPESGVLEVAAEAGAEMQVGDVIGTIDPEAERPEDAGDGDERAEADGEAPAARRTEQSREQEQKQGQKQQQARDGNGAATTGVVEPKGEPDGADVRATSLARKVAADRGVDLRGVQGSGPSGRVRKADVLSAKPGAPRVTAVDPAGGGGGLVMADGATRGVRREKMTKIRRRIAERLVAAQHGAAMLTTFNEADMTEVMRLRSAHKEAFAERHGVGLGFMSFFVKACVSALRSFPRVNAYIDGEEIEYHDYVDVSVAVGTERGLVVPVMRNAEAMTFAEIESTIRDFAERAREGKLSIEEMTGGTFTISNGGVYGSLSSTPILNPPQSAILGMHRIQKRPVEDPERPGEIALRPMMYLALSYDHRIVDGAEAVGFLVHVKECIERPERLLIGI